MKKLWEVQAKKTIALFELFCNHKCDECPMQCWNYDFCKLPSNEWTIPDIMECAGALMSEGEIPCDNYMPTTYSEI